MKERERQRWIDRETESECKRETERQKLNERERWKDRETEMDRQRNRK
jgi:hypothetical protein